MTGASIPAELVEYLEELVRRLGAVTTLDAVYLFGSAAQGAYEHGRRTGEWVSKRQAAARA